MIAPSPNRESPKGLNADMTEPSKTWVEYKIDSKQSLFTVQVFASMIHSLKFTIRNFYGAARSIPGSLRKASVRIEIASTSLEIQDEVNPEERREIERIMFQEVLQTNAFHKIVFESSIITVNPISEFLYRVKVVGTLTLRGITRNHTFEAQVSVGPETLRAKGNFTLLQTNYGIKLVSFARGILMIRDELKFDFFILARRRASKI
jgi:polyisoprenoid-binding protein YceI